MNIKNIFRNIWRTASATALLLSVAVSTSCNNEDEVGAPYFRLENVVTPSKFVTNTSELGFDVEALVGDPTLELIRYDIRTNGTWSAECSSEDAKWLLIYPADGKGDGKVRFCVTDNDATAPRSTTVVFRYGNGHQTEVTLAVNQMANTPYIKVSATANNTTTQAIEAEHAAISYTVNVGSNVDFFYTSTESDWFTLTEKSNGLFQLDIAAYPDEAAILERSGKITFQGAGKYASIKAELPIHQSIVPYIQTVGDNLTDNILAPFEASSTSAVTFTLKSNYDWTITQPDEDSWYTVSPSEGEAYKSYTITVKPMSKNTGAERIGMITLTANTAVTEITISQEGSGGVTKPIVGLPVTWSFPADGIETGMVNLIERWYKSDDSKAEISIVQPSRTPANPNMSYTLGGDGEIGRILSYGFCLDNYWLFTIPVENLRAETTLQLNTIMSSSAAGPKFFMLEYSTDKMKSWTAANVKTGTIAGREVKYTLILPYVGAANQDLVVNETFTIDKGVSKGTFYIRLRVCDARSNKDDKDIIPGNGGTTRMKTRAGSCEQFSVRVIE